MVNWDFKFKDGPNSRLKKIPKISSCEVCGKKLGLFESKRVAHKGECKRIYRIAYDRWRKGLNY